MIWQISLFTTKMNAVLQRGQLVFVSASAPHVGWSFLAFSMAFCPLVDAKSKGIAGCIHSPGYSGASLKCKKLAILMRQKWLPPKAGEFFQVWTLCRKQLLSSCLFYGFIWGADKVDKRAPEVFHKSGGQGSAFLRSHMQEFGSRRTVTYLEDSDLSPK